MITQRGERAYQRGYTSWGGVAYKSGGTPSPTWSVLQPGGPPLLIPLSSIGDMSLSPGDFCQDSCPGWLPPVPLNLVSPPSVLSFLTPDWLFSCNTIFQKYFCCSRFSRFDCKRFPTTRILSISFLCVFCSLSGVEPLCQTTADWKSLLI